MKIRAKTKMKTLFFNFALREGHFMATPVFNPKQSLIGEVIHALERFSPRFAWIQFLFSQRDYNHLLMYTKSELENYTRLANTSEYDPRSRQKIPTKEITTQWYKFATPRIKKIEQTLPKATVILSINGMWVANEGTSKSIANQIQELPFSLCSDEIDRLRAFWYSDPRILTMLVERRMVNDVSPSIYRYDRSREEPPSLILTPDEIPYYIHMPSGVSSKGLSSIRPAPHFPVGGTLGIRNLMPRTEPFEGRDSLQLPLPQTRPSLRAMNFPVGPGEHQRKKDERWNDGGLGLPAIAVLKKIPTLEEPLEDEEVQRLNQIVSRNVRTFELLYDSEKGTRLLLSSSSETAGDDLESVYIPELESVYGNLDYDLVSDNRPEFVVKELPRILNLSASN
jgi:hypothetical protein